MVKFTSNSLLEQPKKTTTGIVWKDMNRYEGKMVSEASVVAVRCRCKMLVGLCRIVIVLDSVLRPIPLRAHPAQPYKVVPSFDNSDSRENSNIEL